MQPVQSFDPSERNKVSGDAVSGLSAPSPTIDQALEEIEHTLTQMLTLTQLSASNLNLDRKALQKTLERLQDKIDQIADMI